MTPELATRRDALARNIATRLGACSHDELRILDRVLAGIEAGHHEYGPLDLARDERDFGAEGESELRDFLFYACAREIAANDRRLERLRCEVADEIRDTEVITAPHERFDVGGES